MINYKINTLSQRKLKIKNKLKTITLLQYNLIKFLILKEKFSVKFYKNYNLLN